jgi:ATP-binding cassette subfamily B protein
VTPATDAHAAAPAARRRSALWRVVPYVRPQRRRLAVGLALVVASSAFGAVLPWLLQVGVDAMRAGEPASRVWGVAAAMLGVTLAAGVLRYYMREVLNRVSRVVEYDLRAALFAHLTTLDAAYFARTRTGDLMARLTNDLGAVRMAARPAIMYLVNTVAGGAFALAFMLRIDCASRARAAADVLLPFVTCGSGARSTTASRRCRSTSAR